MATEENKIKVHWLNLSRSQRIIWLLEELKLPYEIVTYHRNKETLLAPPELEKVHPLGKSPVIEVPSPDGKPTVIAESGFMTQYLVDHSPEGKKLIPAKWRDGMENKMGGETPEWMRYQYYLHYAEGSLMPPLVVGLICMRLKGPQVPFLARPITGIIANRIASMFVVPNLAKHLKMLNDELAGRKYLCSDTLTAADILMSFPLIAGSARFDTMGTWNGKAWREAFPNVAGYVDRIQQEEGYKRSIEKIEAIDGKFESSL